jgi:hypothetical protein
MKRAVFIAVAVAILTTAQAAPASAQTGFIRWLERLSGPGPFVGGGIELSVLCRGVETERPGGVAPEGEATPSWFWDANCGHASRDHRRVTIGASWARMVGNNTLQYDATVPDNLKKRVTASMFLLNADLGVARSIDVGAAVGFTQFSGTPPGPFSRAVAEPLRITWKPLAMKPVSPRPTAEEARAAYRREWLQVRMVVTVLPGGFKAEDFGAIPGSYRSSTEVQTNLYVMVNVANLLGW